MLTNSGNDSSGSTGPTWELVTIAGNVVRSHELDIEVSQFVRRSDPEHIKIAVDATVLVENFESRNIGQMLNGRASEILAIFDQLAWLVRPLNGRIALTNELVPVVTHRLNVTMDINPVWLEYADYAPEAQVLDELESTLAIGEPDEMDHVGNVGNGSG